MPFLATVSCLIRHFLFVKVWSKFIKVPDIYSPKRAKNTRFSLHKEVKQKFQQKSGSHDSRETFRQNGCLNLKITVCSGPLLVR